MDELLGRLINGDMNAFDEIVEYFEKKLFYIALARTKDEIISKEAVQDTFICLYMNIKLLRKVGNFNSWIVKILINNCNRKYMKKSVTEVSFEGMNAELFMHDDYNIEEAIDKINFFELISPLNEDDRTIMALYYKDNYNTIEIAEIMNMNENTVRTRMRRAREIIKRKIEGGD